MECPAPVASLAYILWGLLVTELYLAEWVAAGATLGFNYGVSSRVGVTLRATPEQMVAGTLVRDPQLLMPHTGSTVSGSLLFGLSFGLPAALCLLVNVLQAPLEGGRLGPRSLARGTRDVHHLMLAVLQAYALATCWKIWLNVSVGRQRPDWYTRIASGEESLVHEGRMSYPSGHAAYSHTSGSCCFWYLAGRLGVLGSGLSADAQPARLQFLRLLGAAMPVGLATFVATSRITDGVHHFSDVNAGTFLGLSCGTLCYHLHFHPFWTGGRVQHHCPRTRLEEGAATRAMPHKGPATPTEGAAQSSEEAGLIQLNTRQQ